MQKMGPWGPKHNVFDDQFYSKMPGNTDAMYFSIFIQENIWYQILPKIDLINKKLWVLFQWWVPGARSNDASWASKH